MLKSHLGIIEIKGSKGILEAELSTLVKSLLDDKILSTDEINECVRVGMLSDEELIKELASSKSCEHTPSEDNEVKKNSQKKSLFLDNDIEKMLAWARVISDLDEMLTNLGKKYK